MGGVSVSVGSFGVVLFESGVGELSLLLQDVNKDVTAKTAKIVLKVVFNYLGGLNICF